MTNREFANRVGCHITAASRFRNGHRRPGTWLFERIVTEFRLPRQMALTAWHKGPKTFGTYLRKEVFST